MPVLVGTSGWQYRDWRGRLYPQGLAQARWLALSSNSKQIFTHNSSEYIQFDEPETLINAVREVYDQAKRPIAAHGD